MDLYMNIASMSTSMAQAQVMTQISTEIMSMSLSTVEQQGDSIVNMLESSVTPNLGTNIDIYV